MWSFNDKSSRPGIKRSRLIQQVHLFTTANLNWHITVQSQQLHSGTPAQPNCYAWVVSLHVPSQGFWDDVDNVWILSLDTNSALVEQWPLMLVRLGRFCVVHFEGWRMVKSETRRDAEILVRNPSPRLFGKKFRDSKKVKTNHAKTRFQDLS